MRQSHAPRGLAGPLEWECSSDACEPTPMSLADALFGAALAAVVVALFAGVGLLILAGIRAIW